MVSVGNLFDAMSQRDPGRERSLGTAAFLTLAGAP
jgi:hypothetical protein